MSIPFTHNPPSDLFTPVGVLPDWTQAMRRATHAHHTGHWALAASQYQTALGMALGLLCQDPGAPHTALVLTDEEADARVCALVSTHRCLADMQTDEGQPDLAATTLAQAHVALLQLISAHPHASAWHRAAVWRCRDTHAALLAHWGEHGAHPDIDRALRAGCLTLNTASAPFARVH